MPAQDYILGYIVKGKFQLTKPDGESTIVYNPAYVEAICLVNDTLVKKQNDIMDILNRKS